MGDGGRGVPKGTHDAPKTDHACHFEIYHRTEQTCKRLKNCKLVIVSSANYYSTLYSKYDCRCIANKYLAKKSVDIKFSAHDAYLK